VADTRLEAAARAALATDPSRARVFEYQGRRYTSLTAIACHIAGTRWSGPAFFGLTTKERA